MSIDDTSFTMAVQDAAYACKLGKQYDHFMLPAVLKRKLLKSRAQRSSLDILRNTFDTIHMHMLVRIPNHLHTEPSVVVSISPVYNQVHGT